MAMTPTTATAVGWCLNCPESIRPGNAVLVSDRPEDPAVPTTQIHQRCEGLPEFDPDAAL